ncbi:hypothetical protein O181_121642 [Austropuccinia psidii MF-1]|uniref:Uncharacterized protein n=1 Tax=Austropuccinia psidii MF-1 TaxID=1389203 RepID=A0A9Q3KLJ0_9BASI|nr:hypothetical protein [Austropuccinia psidii MF-1]
MSAPRYSSMGICMFQPFSTKTHSCSKGDRQGVAFTPYQHKQHIKKLKSAIEPKILTFASGSDCPKTCLVPIFPKDYYQLTQSTFFPQWGLNQTALKEYSGSQKLPPQDLGMIISPILYLRYNIARRLHTFSFLP